jgi:hypothetical protein
MQQFLGNWEGFRKFGFASDDLFCMTSASVELGGKLGLYCLLKTQGKEFIVFCGQAIGNEQETREQYKRCCEAMLTGKVAQEDMDRLWQASMIHQDPLGFALALTRKGITPPKSLS